MPPELEMSTFESRGANLSPPAETHADSERLDTMFFGLPGGTAGSPCARVERMLAAREKSDSHLALHLTHRVGLDRLFLCLIRNAEFRYPRMFKRGYKLLP